MTSTTSTDWPPICSPKLPPVIVRKAGCDHSPASSRALITPLPRWAPKMNPAFTVLGMMAIASARSKMDSGTPLSGAPRIASNTPVAARSRSSSSSCAKAVPSMHSRTTVVVTNRRK